MPWIYTEDGVSVTVTDNRSVTYTNVYEVYALEHQTFSCPEQALRNRMLPHLIKVHLFSWGAELINNEIEPWIIDNLEGKWCYVGMTHYRFEKATDAAMFKLQWA